MIKYFLILFCFFSTYSVSSEEVLDRGFRLGFTPYPSTYDFAGYEKSYSAIQSHADIISHTFQEGIPWEHALYSSDYRAYPGTLQEHWDFLLQMDDLMIPGMTRYVSFLPTNIQYTGLATLWNEIGPGQPLNFPWDTLSFNSPSVKTALLNYSIAIIDTFEPEYFGLGVEINILLAKRFDLWEDYKELNQFLYTELKQRFPSLYIFPTIQYEHMLGLHESSSQLKDYLIDFYPDVLWKEVYLLMLNSDAFAISTFPYLAYNNHIYEGYYDLALALASALSIPVTVDQMGSLSQDVDLGFVTLLGSETEQLNVVYYLLLLAYQNDFLFMISFFTQDYAENYGTSSISLAWAYTGLLFTDGTSKPSMNVWDLFLGMPYR